MKKFLLLALLTMGATSFAGVEGTASDVQLPITVKGSVIDSATKHLIITPLNNANINGTEMLFQAGDIKKSDSHKFQTAKFKIERADASVFSQKDKIEVGLGSTTATTATTVLTPATGGNITINYAISGNVNPTNKNLYEGAVVVQLKTDANVKAGEFTDTSKPIVVKVTTSGN